MFIYDSKSIIDFLLSLKHGISLKINKYKPNLKIVKSEVIYIIHELMHTILIIQHNVNYNIRQKKIYLSIYKKKHE